jgi:hypothetical protein
VPRELLAGCAALAVEGYATLVHSGGAINDVLPAYLAVALLGGLGLGNRTGLAGAGLADDRLADDGLPGTGLSGTGPSSTGLSGTGRWVTTGAGVLILAQVVFLLASPHPARPIPANTGRAVGERLIAGMRALGGDVADVNDPSLSLQAGMTPAAVPGAVFDVVRATDKAGIASYLTSAAAAVKAHQFSAMISSGGGKPLYNPPHLLKYYQECKQPLPAGPATLLIPVAGYQPRPAFVWIPRGGSCQRVLSILNGGKAAGS